MLIKFSFVVGPGKMQSVLQKHPTENILESRLGMHEE
jgi:hypothetical protein